MEYQICKRCIMDTSDAKIQFDENGFCNHCTEAITNMPLRWTPDDKKLEAMFEQIKNAGKGKEYDCIIGISGGIDSSYLAYIASRFGLRMLGIHVDAGWNTEISQRNIQLLQEKLKFKLKIIKIDQKEMMDLQRAYFRSEVINQDVPQDHAFFSALYKYAYENKIKYFLTGSNYSSESILPLSWIYDAYDSTNIRSIHKKFGTVKLKTYPIMSFFKYRFKYFKFFNLQKVAPLNLIDYDKEKAIKELNEKIGFEYYGAKHCESVFTRLYQSYILPVKYGIDKRRCHLSSLIVAGQLTRDDALAEVAQPLCTKEQIESDINEFIKTIGISREEFDENVKRKGGKPHTAYKTEKGKQALVSFAKKILGRK